MKDLKSIIKDSILLPKIDFPIKDVNFVDNEKKILEFWEEKGIHQKILEKNSKSGSKEFVLHSGPIYSNGEIHVGHVLNIVLKDITNRSILGEGHLCDFFLGWDNHGLPIEHKVLQTFNTKEEKIREVCKNFSLQQVEIQRKQIRNLGISTDYNKYYLTLGKNYVAEQIRVFAKLVERGAIYRDLKPVYWSCGSKTALAENEIEYYPKKSFSVYFKVWLKKSNYFASEKKTCLLVWTTQPWTIAANRLIAVKSSAFYTLLEGEKENIILLKEKKQMLIENNFIEKNSFLGSELIGLKYEKILVYNKDGYIVDGSSFVEESEGTGIVHLAPAFGLDDFQIAKKEGLKVEMPLDPDGILNEKIGFPNLVGLKYDLANLKIIENLETNNLLFKKDSITHSYPHDWRDKSPLIYRLTEQWFINLKNIKVEANKEIERVNWVPNWTKKKMSDAIDKREDWCLSRQRKWGVPIPVFFEEKRAILKPTIINYVAELIEMLGPEIWFSGEILDYLAKKFPEFENKDLKLGEDIMDVWFDSGVSHWCAISKGKLAIE